MMFLFFSLNEDTYAARCERVREVSPMVTLKKVPHAPDHFAGFFHYRGMVIPVVDLCRVVLGQPCRMRLSTRIIVVEIPKEDKTTSIMGFIAENVTEISRRLESSLIMPGAHLQSLPYLGGVLMDNDQMVHVLDLDLLTKSLSVPPGAEGGF